MAREGLCTVIMRTDKLLGATSDGGCKASVILAVTIHVELRTTYALQQIVITIVPYAA